MAHDTDLIMIITYRLRRLWLGIMIRWKERGGYAVMADTEEHW